MKIIKIIISCLTLCGCGAFAQANWFVVTNLAPYPAQLTIKVLDDNGNSIEGITVGASTFSKHISGDNFGTDKYETVTGVTDTNGITTLAFPCITGEAAYNARPFAGFYGTVGSQNIRLTNVVAGKWQPWNPTLEIVLKQKGIQVPMYHREIREIKIPVETKPVGFDLMVGDWIAPYGKGEASDFVFTLERKPMPEVPVREIPPFDVTLTLSFSNDGDGIQSVFAPLRGVSELRLPRQAPSDGYEPVLVKHHYKERGQPAHIEFREDQNYFFRVRTKKDAQGNIISALYGKIDGDFTGGIAGKISFTYYLNPESNSRNMEYNGKNLAN